MKGGLHLDPRLKTIADCVGACRVAADIGCDHGRLGAYLLQTGRAEKVWFSDLSEKSLEKARSLTEHIGVSERAGFFAGDGASALPGSPDAAVIAGMGGETMAGVIERGREILQNARLVLQPSLDAELVRRTLNRFGFRLEKEAIVRSGGRLYMILAACPGQETLTEAEFVIGPRLLRDDPPLLSDYAAFRMRVLREALLGAEEGGDRPAADRARRELSFWEATGRW